MASKTFIDGGVDNLYSTDGNWSPVASVPEDGDDVIFNANSPDCDMQGMGTFSLRSFDMNGYTNTISNGGYITVVGESGQTTVCRLTGNNSTPIQAIQPKPVSGATINVTCNGITFSDGVFMSGDGTVNITDTVNAEQVFTIEDGTCTVNVSADVNCGSLYSTITGTALNMGSGTWTVGTSKYDGDHCCVLDFDNCTIDAETSHIIFSGGLNYTIWEQIYGTAVFNNITFGAGSGTLFEHYDIECNNLTFEAGSSVTVTNGSTITINGDFTATGDSENIITLLSDSYENYFLFSKSSGIVSCDYLSLTDSHATGGATWYAGGNSSNESGNDGWIFTSPSGSSSISKLNGVAVASISKINGVAIASVSKFNRVANS